ncbi:uncharacterized protein LOC132613292 [Lycium barbarum]|uniref:uncharacterized protein LOC132613292 n=1 Tax=Lycium barbarum TaxID=112863 RepID=UPI00293E82C5|nr:uncharacterized protein LOC132613292 [Lycium barbarum]
MGKFLSSHSTSIEQLESQLSQISATLNQRQKGTLPGDTVVKLKNDGDHKCHAITTRSGKTLVEERLVKDDVVVDDEEIFDEPMVIEEESRSTKNRASIEKPIVVEEVSENDEATQGTKVVEEVPKALTPIPKPPPPFLQRLAKKAKDGKFIKFIEKLKQLSINIPFVEAFEQMPGYAKFMKDLVTKRRQTSFAMGDVMHHCRSIVIKALVQKKEDPRAFTIPCLGTTQPTTMRLLTADQTVKRPVGILFDLLVWVDRFIFPADFVILDIEVDFEVLIILGRPFLATGRSLVDVKKSDLNFQMNNEEITFHICKSMKQLTNMSVVSFIDTIDEVVETVIAHESVGEVLAAVLMNYDGENFEDFKETANASVGLGSYKYNPKKLDLDLEN